MRSDSKANARSCVQNQHHMMFADYALTFDAATFSLAAFARCWRVAALCKHSSARPIRHTAVAHSRCKRSR